MKERGIIFSAPMIRALLAGAKTQTRRIVKPQPDDDARITIGEIGTSNGVAYIGNSTSGGIVTRVVSPYGQVGSRLWVRETHAIVPRTAYARSVGIAQRLRPDDDHNAAIYRENFDLSAGGIRWRPSIHMPRWASRITLEVTAVRIERLHDISEADAEAEGVDRIRAGVPTHRDAYRYLWEDIHGFGAWVVNPWVWVVEFNRVDSGGKEG